MEVEGTIKRVQDAQQITEKFSKRELHLETDGKYPETLNIEFVNDKMSLLDSFGAGQKVNVHVNLKGREGKTPDKNGNPRVFNAIQGWRIEEVSDKNSDTPSDNTPPDDGGGDDLPF